MSGGARAASSSGAAFTAAAQRRHPKGQRRARWTPLSPSPRSEGPGGVQIRRYATWLVNPQMRRGAACGRRCARWPGANTNTAKRIHLRYAARSEGPGGATVGGVAHRGVANPHSSTNRNVKRLHSLHFSLLKIEHNKYTRLVAHITLRTQRRPARTTEKCSTEMCASSSNTKFELGRPLTRRVTGRRRSASPAASGDGSRLTRTRSPADSCWPRRPRGFTRSTARRWCA